MSDENVNDLDRVGIYPTNEIGEITIESTRNGPLPTSFFLIVSCYIILVDSVFL